MSVILSGVEGSDSIHQNNDKYRNLPEILCEVVFGRYIQVRLDYHSQNDNPALVGEWS